MGRDTDLGAGGGDKWPGIHATVLQHWRAARPGGMDAGDKLFVSCRSVTGETSTAKQAGNPPIVPALPLGAEIMGGVQGKWLAWLSGGAGLGIGWTLLGEGHGPSQNVPLPPSLGILCTTTPIPLTSQKQSSGGPLWGHTTTAGPHPAQQRPGLPPLSSIHVAKGSYSSLACVTPHLGCV